MGTGAPSPASCFPSGVSNPLGWDGDLKPITAQLFRSTVSNPLGWDGDPKKELGNDEKQKFLIH